MNPKDETLIKCESVTKCDSVTVIPTSQLLSSPEKVKIIKSDSNNKIKNMYGESKIFQAYIKEKENSNNASGSVFSSEKAFINDINNEKKIASLNNTIMKLNELLEKNMRKINSQEKEIQFTTKRLREAENLNMKMLGELSAKNQTIEQLNNELRKKKERKDEKAFVRKSKRADAFSPSGESTAEIFLKSVSDMLLKEFNVLKLKPTNNNNIFEQYFNDIRLTLGSVNKIEEKGYNNNIEINISQNLYLKNLLKVFILNQDKSKKFNSSKLPYSRLLSNTSTKETDFSDFNMQSNENKKLDV